jgi:hypothetical protein
MHFERKPSGRLSPPLLWITLNQNPPDVFASGQACLTWPSSVSGRGRSNDRAGRNGLSIGRKVLQLLCKATTPC